jgi:membrane-bound lytic murein transglycosylase D
MKQLKLNHLNMLVLSALFFHFPTFSQSLDTKPTSSILSFPQNVSEVSSTDIPDEQWHSETPIVISETNLWVRIKQGYAIPNLENQLVDYQTDWYSSRIKYFHRTLQRGSIYLYHVVDELEKRGMPTDLALLPFIESAFNPHAISSAKASGLWQFMPATGRDFNLNQNIFKDDRRGILDSTNAALDYLQKLYGMFGDWQLVLAAYNWGEGSVQRAIKKQEAKGLPIDFNSLSALMPKETKNYVPKLQAVKNIIDQPELFNISLPQLDNKPYFTSISKEKDIDVKLAAQFAELPIQEFQALNPQFNRPIITGSNNTSILLPIENAHLFEDNILQWTGPLATWTTYRVNRTERIETLASRLGFKDQILREVNVINPKMYIKAGSTILIPKTLTAKEENIPEQVAELGQLATEKRSQKLRKIKLKIKKNDSLNSISKQYKVSSLDIKEWNKLQNNFLRPGQNIFIYVEQTIRQKTIKTSTKS